LSTLSKLKLEFVSKGLAIVKDLIAVILDSKLLANQKSVLNKAILIIDEILSVVN